jgi:site-specific DNA-methyltransferase (adenine-specific)
MIIHGDCLKVMAGMPASSFDLVIADPPYNIGVDYGDGSKADRRLDYPAWCRSWISQCWEVLNRTGSLWVISGQEHGADIDLAIREVGFKIRNRITWHETFGVYCHGKFGRTSRPIFYAVKGSSFTFNADAVRVPSARQSKYGDKRANPAGKIMGDVWEIPRVCGTFKQRVKGVPTQLPETLVERIILVSSVAGDNVLDPFAGSGTTVAVSQRLKRIGIGIEKSEVFCGIARDRCSV